MRPSFLLTAVSLSLVACSRGDEAPAADSSSLLPLTASLATETGGMKSPESARYDVELDVFYVSNIDGNPSARDGNGFIAVVPAESLGIMRVLVAGGKAGATLNAPKGLALNGDTLWVTDIDAVRGFNRRTGAPLATIDLSAQGATFLNDVAVGPNGALYVTDSGIRIEADGSTTQPGPARIFKVAQGAATELARGEALHNVNGLTWQDTTGVWLLASSSNDVMTWSEGDSLPRRLATGPGEYDGIEALSDGRILVSSWADSAVHLITNGAMTTLIPNVSAPADIGYDLKRGVIAVPRLQEGKVGFYQLKAG